MSDTLELLQTLEQGTRFRLLGETEEHVLASIRPEKGKRWSPYLEVSTRAGCTLKLLATVKVIVVEDTQ